MDSSTLPHPATEQRPGLPNDSGDGSGRPRALAPLGQRSVLLALVATAVASGTLAAGVTAGLSAGAEPVRPSAAAASPASPEPESTPGAAGTVPTASPGAAGGQLATDPTPAPGDRPTSSGDAADTPDPGSGRIGPWQQMGHVASPERAVRQVAAEPRGVVLIGDSLATRIRPALSKALGKRPLVWDHWNGRPTHGSVDVVAALDQAGRLPQTLLMLSGSNDVFDPLRFATQVDRTMEIAGPKRTVIWAVPTVRRAKFADADVHNSAIIGAALRRAAATYPNLTLLDWDGHLEKLPEAQARALMPDGVHPSPAGCVELARLIAAELR